MNCTEIESDLVSLSYIAKKVGKRNNFVSCWIRLRPSLNIKKINKREGNHPICLFKKDEAERLIRLINERDKYPQEFRPTECNINDNDDFSNEDWWVV